MHGCFQNRYHYSCMGLVNMDPVVDISHLSIQCCTYILYHYCDHCIAHVHYKLLCDMTFLCHIFDHSNQPRIDMCKKTPFVYIFLGLYMVSSHMDRLAHIVALSILHYKDKLGDGWKQYILRYHDKYQNDNQLLLHISFLSIHSDMNI